MKWRRLIVMLMSLVTRPSRMARSLVRKTSKPHSRMTRRMAMIWISRQRTTYRCMRTASGNLPDSGDEVLLALRKRTDIFDFILLEFLTHERELLVLLFLQPIEDPLTARLSTPSLVLRKLLQCHLYDSTPLARLCWRS
ncbi:unnamed protein product [Amoebophrya sp. A25]|nr:unnamed protein product [Amoebophrya sp. A25]|eukprot:GSA25T00012993001.1